MHSLSCWQATIVSGTQTPSAEQMRLPRQSESAVQAGRTVGTQTPAVQVCSVVQPEVSVQVSKIEGTHSPPTHLSVSAVQSESPVQAGTIVGTQIPAVQVSPLLQVESSWQAVITSGIQVLSAVEQMKPPLHCALSVQSGRTVGTHTPAVQVWDVVQSASVEHVSRTDGTHTPARHCSVSGVQSESPVQAGVIVGMQMPAVQDSPLTHVESSSHAMTTSGKQTFSAAEHLKPAPHSSSEVQAGRTVATQTPAVQV